MHVVPIDRTRVDCHLVGPRNLTKQFTRTLSYVPAQDRKTILGHPNQMILAVPYSVTAALRVLHDRSIASRSPKGEGFTDPIWATLKKFKRYDSEVSTASAIAYFLYDLIGVAWDDSINNRGPSDEELEDLELSQTILNEATLLGYLWAKIEFEANLKPLADIAKQRKIDNKRGGEKSGEIRRKNAEQGWVKIAKILAIRIRDKQAELSQDDLAFEIGVLWTSDIEPPGTARTKQLISEMEKSGELAKRAAQPKSKRKQLPL